MNFVPLMTEIAEKSIRKLSESALNKVNEKIFDKPISDFDKPLAVTYDNLKHCPLEGNGGKWSGERGNSDWYPDIDAKPGKFNMEGRTWQEILTQYGIDHITFYDGEPEFSEISKGSVEIKQFSDKRTDNFDKADIELANQKGCSPQEVANWRKENGFTWHECKDMKTMQKVPGIIHNNITHSGGISEIKKGYGDNR